MISLKSLKSIKKWIDLSGYILVSPSITRNEEQYYCFLFCVLGKAPVFCNPTNIGKYHQLIYFH
jgi:hypothetical protein